MELKRLARATAALLGLAVLAAALFQGVLAALAAAGVPYWVAFPTAVGAVLPPVLAVADAYTPLSNHDRTAALRERSTAGLAADAVLAAVVGALVGFAGSYVFLSPDASSLRELVVVSAASLSGYAAFVARNFGAYGVTEPAEDGEVGR